MENQLYFRFTWKYSGSRHSVRNFRSDSKEQLVFNSENHPILKESIGILGCGWLGLPLAKSLIKDGYEVKGSTTSQDKLAALESNKIHPFLIRLEEDGIDGDIQGFLQSTDILIINVPPRLKGGQNESYVEKMRVLNTSLKDSNVKKVVFASSTSVYGDYAGEVTEKTTPHPTTESGRQLMATEDIFWNNSKLEVSIIRFGGLIGPKRHPVFMLSGKKKLENGGDSVNLVHLDDCIAIIAATVKNGWWGQIFNGVYPLHPTKKEYYTKEARKRGLSPPNYSNENRKWGKIIVPYTLINVKKYRFKTSIVS